MTGTRRDYLIALRDGVLGGAAAAVVIYALAMLVTATGLLTGMLGDTYSHSLMGITVTRQETNDSVAGSVVMSGLTVAGIIVIGVLVALSRRRRRTRAAS
jgi:ABC-type Fe3+ transport system permease subunit